MVHRSYGGHDDPRHGYYERRSGTSAREKRDMLRLRVNQTLVGSGEVNDHSLHMMWRALRRTCKSAPTYESIESSYDGTNPATGGVYEGVFMVDMTMPQLIGAFREVVMMITDQNDADRPKLDEMHHMRLLLVQLLAEMKRRGGAVRATLNEIEADMDRLLIDLTDAKPTLTSV